VPCNVVWWDCSVLLSYLMVGGGNVEGLCVSITVTKFVEQPILWILHKLVEEQGGTRRHGDGDQTPVKSVRAEHAYRASFWRRLTEDSMSVREVRPWWRSMCNTTAITNESSDVYLVGVTSKRGVSWVDSGDAKQRWKHIKTTTVVISRLSAL